MEKFSKRLFVGGIVDGKTIQIPTGMTTFRVPKDDWRVVFEESYTETTRPVKHSFENYRLSYWRTEPDVPGIMVVVGMSDREAILRLIQYYSPPTLSPIGSRITTVE